MSKRFENNILGKAFFFPPNVVALEVLKRHDYSLFSKADIGILHFHPNIGWDIHAMSSYFRVRDKPANFGLAYIQKTLKP